jgi:hypothetical protein
MKAQKSYRELLEEKFDSLTADLTEVKKPRDKRGGRKNRERKESSN